MSRRSEVTRIAVLLYILVAVITSGLASEAFTCQDKFSFDYTNKTYTGKAITCFETDLPCGEPGLTYTLPEVMNSLYIENVTGNKCLKHLESKVPATDCVNVTAHDPQDENITSQFEVCITFNHPPVLGDTLAPNTINLASATPPINITIPVDTTGPGGIHVLQIKNVTPAGFESNFNSLNTEAVITLVGSPNVENVTEINIEIFVIDGGIPRLTDSKTFKLTLLKEQINCDDTDTIYIDVEKIITHHLECSSLANNIITYSVADTSRYPFNVTIAADGTITVTLTQTATPGGVFNIAVKATTIMEVQTNVQLIFDLGHVPWCNDTMDSLVLSRQVNKTTSFTCYYKQDQQASEHSAEISDEAQDAFRITTTDNPSATSMTIEVVQKTFKGPQELVVQVSNNYGKTLVTFNIKRPPIFIDTTTQFTLDETAGVDFVLFTFSIDDPDPSPGTLLVFDALDRTNQLPFVMKGKELTVSKTLNATLVSQYFLSVKVTDATGLTDIVNITVTVDDVNEAPTCAYVNNNLILSVDKMQAPGQLTMLACFDTDFEDDLKTLTYTFTSESDQQYVQFFQFGQQPNELMLKNSLTNVDLPDSNSFDLKVNVSDQGQPALFTLLNIRINVFDNRPFCRNSKLALEISEKDELGTCFNITHDCTDPLSEGLTFSSDSSFLQIKTEPRIISHLTLCLKKSVDGIPGNYESQIRVANRNYTIMISLMLTVDDVNEAPVFTNLPSDGVFNVMEDASFGHLVAVISVNDVDPRNVSNGQYRVSVNSIGAGMPGIVFNYTDYSFFVESKLNAAQHQIYKYNITVVDGGGLSASTTVEIHVQDVNEAPSCSPARYQFTVEVIAAVGHQIGQIHCEDPDVQDNYTKIIYKIEQPHADLISINDKGEVILAKTLPLDKGEYEITATAYNDVDQTLSTSVSVKITVNRAFPPNCSATKVDMNLNDTDSSGTCSSVIVMCTSPVTGGLTIHTDGNLTRNIAVQTTNTTSGVAIQACVKSSLRDSIGFYEVTITVKNQVQQNTSFIWSFRIEDKNEPPAFKLSTYSVTVNENLPSGSTIVSLDVGTGLRFAQFNGKVIEAKDPDSYTDAYQIKSVSADPSAFKKSDNTPVQLTNYPIEFSQSVFSVKNSLDASLLYTYVITVVDGQNMSANATLKIKVNDINEAPTCTVSSVAVNKSLLITEDKIIVRLSCTDPDYEDSYKTTAYKLDGPNKEFFNISSSGVVMMAEALPRDKDVLTFSAVAVDGANSTLTYTVSINITVLRDIPASCQVQRHPPLTWVFNSCYNITLGCTDPTTGDSSTIKYKFSGNYTGGFTFKEENGNLVMCYNKTESGMYIVNIEVNNGLQPINLEEQIEVKYERSTPVFKYLPIQETVLYDTSIGKEVFRVTAETTGNFSGDILYSLLESTPVSALASFVIDQQSGVIKVADKLKPFIGKKITLKIQALDNRSQLKATADALVTIEETNIKPTCPDRSEGDTINIEMTAKVGKVIAVVNCSDLNILKKYNTLTYKTTGGGNNFNVDSMTGKVSIAKNLPFKDFYAIFVTASDGFKSDMTTLVIKVNLKLKPTINVMEVTTSSVKIEWTFERSDYPENLDKYTLKWETNDVENQADIDKGSSDYLLDNLKPGTVYFITLISVARGFSVSEPVTVTTKEIPVLSHVTVEFKVTNQAWSAAMSDRTSTEYKNFKNKTEMNIRKALTGVNGIHDVAVISLRKGSVIVDSVISVNQSGEIKQMAEALRGAIAGGQVGDAVVDAQSAVFNYGDKYAVITSLEVAQREPSEITQDSTTSVICKARLVGQGLRPSFKWKLKGYLVQADLSKRLNITQSEEATDDQFAFTSIITFRPITLKDQGSLECIVADTGKTVTASKSMQLNVIAKPEVLLLPMVLYIKEGKVGTLNCSVKTSSDHDVEITWYINNNKVTNIKVKKKDNYEILTVSNVNDVARYSCRASNIAGVVSSNTAIVGQDKEEIFCAAFTDDRGISWSRIPAGKEAKSECTGSYKGTAKRLCLSNGVWQNTTDLTNCKMEALLQLADTANDKKEGFSSDDTETIVKTLANLTSSTTMGSGDIDVSIQIMEDVVHVNEKDSTKVIKKAEIKDFVKAADNILNTAKNEWTDLRTQKKRGAAALMKSIDTIAHLASQQAEGADTSSDDPLVAKNLVLEYGKSTTSDIEFPRSSNRYKYPEWMKVTRTKAFLKSDSYIKALKGTEYMGYSGVCYKDMTEIVTDAETASGSEESGNSIVSKRVNSLILSFSLNPRPAGNLDPPLHLTFEHLSTNFSNPSCGFLDYSRPYETTGRWSSDGCTIVTKSNNLTVCECDHFTNFAILMSPGKITEKDAAVLSIISAVGCAISIFCLILTIGTYIVLWRYVKTDRPDRVIVLLNLCVVLIIAYLLFLLGVNRTDNAQACTAISVLLHYFYLVVFFLMLAEGIELLVCVIYVFNHNSRLHWLMLMSWGIPAIIVGVSLGVTRLKGYGNDDFCWLSLEGGLLWSFVGPALAVIVINTVIVVIVLKTMFSTNAMMTKDAKEKGKAGLKGLCVLLPVMGLTWVFGVFSVNEDLVIFQYLFAIFNSLQGLFIFIFHCLLSRQVQDGMKNRKRRYFAHSYDTKLTYSQSNKPNRKSSEDASGNSETDKKVSPFLEADRQVQQIAEKLSKVEKENFLDKTEQDKGVGTLDKVNVPVELPEVKEDNLAKKLEMVQEIPLQNMTYQPPKADIAANQPPTIQEQKMVHKSLQQKTSIEENMLQRSPDPKPYRQTLDGKEVAKNVRPPRGMPSSQWQSALDHATVATERENMEDMIHDRRKRHNDIYSPLKQSKREQHNYQHIQPHEAGLNQRLAGNSDTSLNEQKYKGRDLPLYIGQSDDKWRQRKQAAEMRKLGNHSGLAGRGQPQRQHVQSEEDVSQYGYYQPFGRIHNPERRLPRTRFNNDDVMFDKSGRDYRW